MRLVRKITILGLIIPWLVSAQLPIAPDLSSFPTNKGETVWPVVPPLPAPDSLRPCCAFGYDLKVEALGVPLPFYRVNNVVEADHLGEHHYNDRLFGAAANLTGLSGEQNGIIYTSRGGFIDTAHVRDTADMTFYLFSHILPQLGKAHDILLGEELSARHIKLFGFTPPQDAYQRYLLAARLAGYLAFQVSAWHEIAQWYGYESVPGFSEGISAFSPEDLYSNVLGARLAMTLILENHGASVSQYNLAMPVILQQALHQLGAVSAQETRFHFDMLDGQWWNSHRYVPEKFLVLKRNYETSDDRLPTIVPGDTVPPLRLRLSESVGGVALSLLGELQLWPGHSMQSLPAPANPYYTFRDFPALAHDAQARDISELQATQ